MSVFDILHRDLRNIIREFGYVEPTPVQERAIPLVYEGHNVLITAPTGTGKTEAAFFPVISRILELRDRGKLRDGVYVLYITPMRALNRDIYVRLCEICRRLGLRMSIRHGDTPESERRRQVETPPHILVTTPETLQIILVAPRMRTRLRTVRFVIIDEVHELVTDKRGTQLAVGLERLVRLSGGFQRIGLSATVGNVEIAAAFIAGTSRKCSIVYVSGHKDLKIRIRRPLPDERDVELSQELKLHPDVVARLRAIDEETRNRRTVLLFTNTRDTAELLGSRLSKIVNYPIGVYHGSLSREERERLEEKLRRGEIKLVIATSSLELGIDIGSIDLVIQYMSPRQVTRLVQRVGRSRHKLGEVSEGVIITSDLDDSLESLVIAKRAVEGQLEKDLEYHELALDVLAHQIVGIVLESSIEGKDVTIDEIYNIVKNAHPYRELSFRDLEKVLKFLEERGLIKIEDKYVRPRRGSYMYYMENTSTIPDEARYSAIDIVSRRKVGELDAEFVSTIEIGTHIVLGGRVWKIANVDTSNKVVHLEPVSDIHGAIPAWLGEEIPVPYEVAQEVVNLRSLLVKNRDQIRRILNNYVSDGRLELHEDFIKYVTDQCVKIGEFDIPLPDSENIVIECTEKIAVIHVGLGSKGNEALGLYLTRYLGKNYLLNVAYRSDPYRVILTFSRTFNPDLIVNALREESSIVYSTLIEAVKNSRLFRYRLVHVARRFGVVPREKVTEVNPAKLAEALRDTVVEEETIREILVDKVDLKRLLDLIDSVRSGKIKVTVVRRGELSPLAVSEEALYSRLEFTVSSLPKSLIVELVKKRLEERELVLICLRCGWTFRGKLKYVPDDVRCPRCEMRVITVLKHKDEDPEKVLKILEKVWNKIPLSKEEEKLLKELRERAALVLQYGKKALYALAGHGIGASTAIRKILSKAKSDDELFMLIIEAEKEYARTRRFWG